MRASIANGYLLDYLIIDEASQVNLLAAGLALSCCRNVVVVGDLQQLPHITDDAANGLVPPRSGYDYRQHNILSSLTDLYRDDLPRTLLREHYRCDPAIIDFCNKTFYEGALIPFTTSDVERPMIVWRTVEGNHMRQHRGGGRSNQREVDVIVDEVVSAHCAGVVDTDIGITTPYRRQVDKLTDALDQIHADTVHKFQGQQKEVVILTSTPLLLLALDGAGGLLGVLPLTIGPMGPTWPGSPLGDEHDVRIRCERPAQAVVSALLQAVPRVVEPDETVLTDVRPDGLLTRTAVDRIGCPAPVVKLNDPDSEFGAIGCLPGWSRKQRRALRSAWRHLEETGNVTAQRLAEQDTLATALPTFALHRLASWAARGRLGELPAMDRHPGFPEFLAEASSSLAAENRCLLARLNVDGEPLAQALFFRSSEADLLYMSTYQPAAARYGPSHLLLAEAAQMAVADGVRVFELGRGDEPYKFALGAQPRYLRNVALPPVP